MHSPLGDRPGRVRPARFVHLRHTDPQLSRLAHDISEARELVSTSDAESASKKQLLRQLRLEHRELEDQSLWSLQSKSSFFDLLHAQHSRERDKLEHHGDRKSRQESLELLTEQERKITEDTRGLNWSDLLKEHNLLGRALEAEVARLADFVTHGELVGFEKNWSRDRRSGKLTGRIGAAPEKSRRTLGEWDVETTRVLIEVTASVHGKTEQLERAYLSEKTNRSLKPVLAFMPMVQNSEMFRAIERIQSLDQPILLVRSPGQLIRALRESVDIAATSVPASFPWQDFPLLWQLEQRSRPSP